MKALLVFFITVLPMAMLSSAHAGCEFPSPPEFAKVAPTASRIFVFRVMSLRVHEQPSQADTGANGYAVFVEADVLVKKTLRGDASSITSVNFTNASCGGINLLVGHHYLIATTQMDDVIELKPGDRTLADIDAEYDPASTGSKQLDSNKFIVAVQAAIDGKRAFDTVLDDTAYRSMATVPPPPELKIIKEPCKQPAPKHPAASKTIKRQK